MDLLTTSETATLLRINYKTVLDMVKRGELPAVRVARRVLFDRSQLEAWVTNGGTKVER